MIPHTETSSKRGLGRMQFSNRSLVQHAQGPEFDSQNHGKKGGEMKKENNMYISYVSHFYGQIPDNSKVKEEVFISVYSLQYIIARKVKQLANTALETGSNGL